MVKKVSIRLILACVLIAAMIAASSCGKKAPGPGEEAEGDQQASEDVRAEEQKQEEDDGEDRSEISEQELEQQRRAEEEKEREKQVEEKKQEFTSEKVYFEFDDSSLTSEARQVLKQKVEWLRDNPDACIIIEGHCDERGTDEYNLALGSRRAESVKDFLVKAGVDASRLTTISYGEERPAVEGEDEDAWARNRRAEFRFCREK
ncbi:MAG: peptidoglycan-associated lipoprotein Pal [Desulfosalsimonas sp.]